MEQTKQLTVLNFNEISTMGKVFAESGMFADAKAAAQAIVKIQAGQEIGIPPFAAMSGIHIIQGKPAIGAGLMASCVKGSGKYDYEVKELSDTICTINFTTKSGKVLGVSTFTIEQAKKALTKNLDKFPANMLFARAMSNGVKWFTPDVFSGPVYTPEELNSNVTEDVSHENVDKSTGEIKAPEPVKAVPVVKTSLSKENLTAAIKRIENGEVGIVTKISENYTVNQPQQKLIDAAALKGEQLNSAIQALDLATSQADIDAHKQTLSTIILESETFKTAEGKAVQAIMAKNI